MKQTLILTLFILCFFSSFSQKLYKQKIGSLGEISFPDTVKLIEADVNVKVYRLQTESEIYFLQISPINTGIRGAFTDYTNEKIYKDFVTGTLNGTQGRLIYQSKQQVDGINGYEWSATAQLSEGKQTVFTNNRIVFLNDTLISFGIWTADSISRDNPKLSAFYNSFKVADKNRTSDSYKKGEAIGRVLGWAITIGLALFVLVGIPVTIFLLIRRARKKKPHTFDPDNYNQHNT